MSDVYVPVSFEGKLHTFRLSPTVTFGQLRQQAAQFFTLNSKTVVLKDADNCSWPVDEPVSFWVDQLPDGFIYVESVQSDHSIAPRESLQSLAESGQSLSQYLNLASAKDDRSQLHSQGSVSEATTAKAQSVPKETVPQTSAAEEKEKVVQVIPKATATFTDVVQQPQVKHFQYAPHSPRSETRKTLLKEQEEARGPVHTQQHDAVVTAKDTAKDNGQITSPRQEMRPSSPLNASVAQIAAAVAAAVAAENAAVGVQADPASLSQQLWRIFTFYAVQGPQTLSVDLMSGMQFFTLLRDCKLIDQNFTRTDCELIFATEVQTSVNRLTYEGFLRALIKVASRLSPPSRRPSSPRGNTSSQTASPVTSWAQKDGEAFTSLVADRIIPNCRHWAQDNVAAALQTNDIEAVFDKHREFVIELFRIYSLNKKHLRFDGFLKMCKDLELHSLGLSVSDIAFIYLRSKSPPADEQWLRYKHRSVLNIAEFVEAIGRCALLGFAKSSNTSVLNKIKGLFLHMTQCNYFTKQMKGVVREQRTVAARLLQASFFNMWIADGRPNYLTLPNGDPQGNGASSLLELFKMSSSTTLNIPALQEASRSRNAEKLRMAVDHVARLASWQTNPIDDANEPVEAPAAWKHVSLSKRNAKYTPPRRSSKQSQQQQPNSARTARSESRDTVPSSASAEYRSAQTKPKPADYRVSGPPSTSQTSTIVLRNLEFAQALSRQVSSLNGSRSNSSTYTDTTLGIDDALVAPPEAHLHLDAPPNEVLLPAQLQGNVAVPAEADEQTNEEYQTQPIVESKREESKTAQMNTAAEQATQALKEAVEREQSALVALQNIERALKQAEDDKRSLQLEMKRNNEAKQQEIYQHRLLALVSKGDYFMKCGRKGSPHSRFVVLSDDYNSLLWGDSADQVKKNGVGPKAKLLRLRDVSSVRAGTNTDVFARLKPKEVQQVASRAFSIIAEDRSLDLIASSKEIRDAWVECLTDLTQARNN